MLLRGDVADREFSGSLPPTNVVVHLAAVTPQSGTSQDPVRMHDVNCGATLALLEYARTHGVKRFFYASTGSVYAPHPSAVSEDCPLSPDDHYAVTKRMGEMYAALYARWIPQVTTLRLFYPYGPRQAPEHLVPRIAGRVRRGEKIPMGSSDGPCLTTMYIDDLVDVLVDLALGTGPTGYRCLNVGSDRSHTLSEIAHTIGNALGKEPCFEISEGPTVHRIADVTALQRSTRIRPQVDLVEGISRVVAAMDDSVAKAW